IYIWADGIYSAQEGRAAIVARQMIESGNWLHLNIKGAHNTEKPVMCYWFYALSGTVFGVNEFSVRLPSILAALVTVLMTALLGMRIYGRRTGLMAGYIMASMMGFVNLSRLARIDIVLCAFYTASMYLLYTGYFEKMKANRRLYLFYLVLALSVMIKGPVSVAVIALTVIVLAAKERNWKIFWELKPISGLFIGLAINAPWYAYEIIRTDGEFFTDFFMNQNISRFTGVNMTYSGGRRRSYFHYIPKLFIFALPWSLLFPFALFNFRKKFLKLKPATYYLLIWFLTVFVFFSLAAIKRGDYLLPLFAPMTILLGRYLECFVERGAKLSKKWLIGWIVLVIIGVCALIMIRFGLLHYVGKLAVSREVKWTSYRDGMGVVQASDFINAMYVWCCLAAALVFAYFYYLGRILEKGEMKKALNGILLIVFAYFCIFYIWIDPSQNKYKTVKYFCARSRQQVKPDEKVCYYVEWITEVVFFMDRDYDRHSRLEEIYDTKSGKVKYKYIITEPDVYNALPPVLKNKLEKLEETRPDHQYPHVLLRKKI
ncbi:MAG: glycosyltransferase family 39 protein, partial [Victivallales bacterium]|nr:glycosyltransferase family 39 protein [Victivallales bacterium]